MIISETDNFEDFVEYVVVDFRRKKKDTKREETSTIDEIPTRASCGVSTIEMPLG